jgi:hypothetical protein
LAAQVPTWAIWLLLLTGMLIRSNSPTMVSTAASMPRFRAMVLAPAVTFFRPSS